MKKVFSSDNNALVGLVRSYLEENNIPCQMRNEHLSSVMGDVPFLDTWPELWVADLLEAQALALIEEVKTPKPVGPDWACRKCLEPNPSTFDICWQCGEVPQGASD